MCHRFNSSECRDHADPVVSIVLRIAVAEPSLDPLILGSTRRIDDVALPVVDHFHG